MAMGNYCYAKGIECPYATPCGNCLDDIYDDYGLCEMEGDNIPPKELSSEERVKWVLSGGKVMDYIISNISKGLYSDDDDYGLYRVIETNHKEGYVIVENRNDNMRYKIVVKAIKE